jgi:hypothetical protein
MPSRKETPKSPFPKAVTTGKNHEAPDKDQQLRRAI